MAERVLGKVDIHNGRLRLTTPDGVKYEDMKTLEFVEVTSDDGAKQFYIEGVMRLNTALQQVFGMVRDIMDCPVDLTRETMDEMHPEGRWKRFAQKLAEYPLDPTLPVTEEAKRTWEEFLKNWDWRSDLLEFLRRRVREMNGE